MFVRKAVRQPLSGNIKNPRVTFGNTRVVAFFENVAKESSIHGFKYIGSKEFHIIERVFWLLVTIAVFGFGIHMVHRLFKKYQQSPIIISFQPQETSVSQIPFPAITICNVNMLKRSVLTRLFEELKVLVISGSSEANVTKDNEVLRSAAHLDHLIQFCLDAPSLRRYLNESMEDAQGQPDFSEFLSDVFANDANIKLDLVSQLANDAKWVQEEREIFEKATIKCEEMLLKCSWGELIVPCIETFFPINTRNGRCCVFNLMPQFILQNLSHDDERLRKEIQRIPPSDVRDWENFVSENLIVNDLAKIEGKNYPKYQRAGGKPYGLTVLVNPDLDEYSTCTTSDGCGFKIVAHSPLSAPSVIDYSSAISPGSETFVDVEPRVILSDDILQNIDTDERGCYLESEVKLHNYKFYSLENCQSECNAELVYRNCKCVRHYMPRNSSQNICGAKQRQCVMNVTENLTRGIGRNTYCGHCLPACTQVDYKLQISHFDIRESNAASFFNFINSDGIKDRSTNYSIIHIFMGTDSIYAKERKTLYTGFDLIANAGGLLELTLGVSIISFIEIIYFCTLRFWFYIRSG